MTSVLNRALLRTPRSSMVTVTRYVTNEGNKSTSQPPQKTPTSKKDDDNSTYKAKEQFGYNPMSFYDIEMDMSKFRNKQPSNKTPMNPPK